MSIQPHDFKFTLLSEDKVWELPQAPAGWEESTLQWARSLEYFGLIKTFSVPLRFVLDGAWLLRRVMYKQGIDGVCILKIELLNRETWQHELLYEGDIDFSTFEDTLTAVEAKIMEMGLSASVAAFSNVEYEFPVLGPGVVDVRLPGIDRTFSGSLVFTGTFTGFSFYFMPTVDVSCSSIPVGGITIKHVDYHLGWNGDPDYAFLVGGPSNQTVRLYGSVEFNFTTANPNAYYLVRFGDNLSTVGTNLYSLVDTRGLTPGNHTVSFDFQQLITAGRNYFISVVAMGDPNRNGNIEVSFGNINISIESTTSSSIVRAFRPKELFRRLLVKMNGTEPEISSALLEEWDNLLITSGDAIRGLQSPSLKTKFNDFFKSINAVLNAGFSIVGGRPTLEKKAFFFRSSILALDLKDSVKDVTIRPAEDFMFNSIRAGYPDDNYEVDQGREEFNSGQIWSTNIRRLQKQIDLTSSYRADQYGIEQLRTAFENPESDEGGCSSPNARNEDKKNDNEVYFILAKKEPGRDDVFDVIGAEDYSNITGISARSSSYNLGISPKKNLLRHSDYLAGALFGNTGFIRFESSDKNASLSTTDSSGKTVTENEDIQVSSLGRPLFLPYEIELTTDLQFDAWKLIQSNSTGYIRFEWREHEFYGFVLEVSQNIERNPERVIRLLLTPENDITKLID